MASLRIMLAAALLPIFVVAGALALITQGLWPVGLVPTLGLLAVIGMITLTAMDRLSTRHT